MPQHVCNGAQISCSFGTAPSSLNILPTSRVSIGNVPVGTIMDNVPMVNIMPFTMCKTITNPQVASATSAALGVLTPMPCVPVTNAPWTPGSSKVMVGNTPALTSTCQLMCTWGGTITIINPNQITVNVP